MAKSILFNNSLSGNRNNNLWGNVDLSPLQNTPYYSNQNIGIPAFNYNKVNPANIGDGNSNWLNGISNWKGWDSFAGKNGWGGMALSGIQALGQGWLGKQQLSQARDNLNFQKDAFNKQYKANTTLANNKIRNRLITQAQWDGLKGVEADKYVSDQMKTQGIA